MDEGDRVWKPIGESVLGNSRLTQPRVGGYESNNRDLPGGVVFVRISIRLSAIEHTTRKKAQPISPAAAKATPRITSGVLTLSDIHTETPRESDREIETRTKL